MPGTEDIAAGQVWWAAPDPTVGREQTGRRPVVLISGDLYNKTVTTLVLAIPLTTSDRGWPNHIEISGMPRRAWAMTEQVRAVSRSRLISQIATATPHELDQLRQWVGDYLVD